ncbi:hypothetical protein D3C86_1273210 [compost metagenome]
MMQDLSITTVAMFARLLGIIHGQVGVSDELICAHGAIIVSDSDRGTDLDFSSPLLDLLAGYSQHQPFGERNGPLFLSDHLGDDGKFVTTYAKQHVFTTNSLLETPCDG